METPPPEPNQNYQAPETDRPAEGTETKAGDNVWLGIGIGLAVLVMGVAAELAGKGRYDGNILFSAVAILVAAAFVLGFSGRRRLGLGLVLSFCVSLLLLVGGCMLLVIGSSFLGSL